MSLKNLLDTPPDLPVAQVLPMLGRAWSSGNPLIVTSPPGSGKTTLMPAVAGTFGPVIVTEPRRVAARAAARRLAALLGQSVGQDVGFQVRGASHPGALVTFVTPGVLVNRLQRDPDLPDISGVIFDEFHERGVDSDLALAFCLDAQATLREDLRIGVLSATLDTARLEQLFVQADLSPAHVDAPGVIYPLDIIWEPPPRGVSALDLRGVTRAFLSHAARVVAQAALSEPGTTLVFMPGVREINQVTRQIRNLLPADVEVLAFYSALSAAQQDRVMAPTPGRRVVVATSIAESSLTVPGVHTVVDACLARVPRVDAGSGIGRLATVLAAQARLEQRAGRAARLGPGRAIRLMDSAEWARRPAFPTPEILAVDLAGPLLQVKAWGSAFEQLALLDHPTPGAIAAGQNRLEALGALEQTNSDFFASRRNNGQQSLQANHDDVTPGTDRVTVGTQESGQLTELGLKLAQLPLDPGLGRALVEGSELVGPQLAAHVVACLDAEITAADADLTMAIKHLDMHSALGRQVHQTELRLSTLLAQTGPKKNARMGEKVGQASENETQLPARGSIQTGGWTQTARAGQRRRSTGPEENAKAIGPGNSPSLLPLEEALGVVVSLAFPQWIACKRNATSWVTVSGQGVVLPKNSPLAGEEWLAIAALQGVGQANALIRAGVPIDQQTALEAGAAQVREQVTASLSDGRVRAERTRMLGAITLSSAPEPNILSDVGRQVVAQALAVQGLGLLPWPEAAVLLRQRLAVLHEVLGNPWPDVSDQHLLEILPQWLGADLERMVRGQPLSSVHTLDDLRTLLPWPEAVHLDELAPERLAIPTGAHKRLDWSHNPPVLTLRVQEAFGWTGTPTVLDGRVPVMLHLTDPAGRPVAVTSDLRSFWGEPYQQVRADLRGRYPKHPWPEDALTATPTSRAKPRR